MDMGWIGRHVGLPTGQNMLAAAAGVALLAVGQISWSTITGCSSAALDATEKGERDLGSDNVAGAERFANDARALSPHCAEVNEFSASLSRKLMMNALVGRLPELAERYRRDCYDRALAGRSILGGSPRILALLDGCSASSSDTLLH